LALHSGGPTRAPSKPRGGGGCEKVTSNFSNTIGKKTGVKLSLGARKKRNRPKSRKNARLILYPHWRGREMRFTFVHVNEKEEDQGKGDRREKKGGSRVSSRTVNPSHEGGGGENRGEQWVKRCFGTPRRGVSRWERIG